MAALLAFALLVLPGAPMRHASAAPMHEAPSHLAAARHCAGQDEGAAQEHALATHDAGHDRHDRLPGDRPDLACCAAAQCPAMIVVPPAAPAQPAPPHEPWVAEFAVPATPDGIPVAPALRPPRLLA